eukprot:gene20314-24326_t
MSYEVLGAATGGANVAAVVTDYQPQAAISTMLPEEGLADQGYVVQGAAISGDDMTSLSANDLAESVLLMSVLGGMMGACVLLAWISNFLQAQDKLEPFRRLLRHHGTDKLWFQKMGEMWTWSFTGSASADVPEELRNAARLQADAIRPDAHDCFEPEKRIGLLPKLSSPPIDQDSISISFGTDDNDLREEAARLEAELGLASKPFLLRERRDRMQRVATGPSPTDTTDAAVATMLEAGGVSEQVAMQLGRQSNFAAGGEGADMDSRGHGELCITMLDPLVSPGVQRAMNQPLGRISVLGLVTANSSKVGRRVLTVIAEERRSDLRSSETLCRVIGLDFTKVVLSVPVLALKQQVADAHHREAKYSSFHINHLLSFERLLGTAMVHAYLHLNADLSLGESNIAEN